MSNDLELLGDEFRKAEEEADSSHWDACRIAWHAWATARDEWAWLLHKFSGKSTDQVRNRRNSWAMYLELIAETDLADPIKSSLYFSHFQNGYRFLFHRTDDGVKVKTDMTSLVELFIQAKLEGLSVDAFAALLDSIFGKNPADKYKARLGRFGKELGYIYGLSEANHVSQKRRRAMRLLIGRLK